MEEQAAGLATAIAVFRIDGQAQQVPHALAPAPVATALRKPARRAAPTVTRTTSSAAAVADTDWAEF
jgi:methyl-accepting chemotaxis protein